MLAARVDNSLGQLVNQLAHASGVDISGAPAVVEQEPARPTHFLGVKLDAAPQPLNLPKMKEKVQSAASLLMSLADEAFKDFLVMEPSVLKETYGDLIIRAVAVKAGMDVTPTHPEKVNVAFIREVAAQVKVKTEQLNQVKDADEASAVAAQVANPEAGTTVVDETVVNTTENETNPNPDANKV